MEQIKVIIDWCDNYGAVSPHIPGCVATHITFDGVKEAYISALGFHLEGLANNEIPECLQGEYELVFELSVQALLHRFDGIITRSALSRAIGINERQLGHYLSGYRTPRPDKREIIIKGLHDIGEVFINVV